nr:DUF1080 domain-containing protein [Paraflavitalea speifideiaquila]
MLKRFCLLLSIVGAIACSTPKKPPDQHPQYPYQGGKKDGWQLLFDGSTKNGWRIYNNRTDGAAWKVGEGALYFEPTARGPKGEGAGELITTDSFENFHLKLEWKLTAGGNSGIMILAREDLKYRYAYITAPEMQIIDNDKHPDAKNIKHRAGDLYDFITAAPENVRPIGEWNQVEIVLNNGKLDLYQNGAKVVSTTLWDDNWAAMKAQSKFKNTPISLLSTKDILYCKTMAIKCFSGIS